MGWPWFGQPHGAEGSLDQKQRLITDLALFRVGDLLQSLESVPTWFADYTGISLGAAQAIISIVVILAVLLPTMYLSRGNKSTIVEIVMLFLTEGFLVAIGWLPFWLLVATVALMAMAVATLGTRVVTGG